MLWLDPSPLPEDVPLLYRRYYTHQAEQSASAVSSGWLVRGYRKVVAAYLYKKYQYGQKPVGIFSSLLPFLLYLLPGRSELVDYNVAYQSFVPGGRILEIGCGSGEMLRYLDRLGWVVEGIDVDPKAVAVARNSGLKVYCGDPLMLSIAGGSYDVVTMGHVIEHVYDPRKLLVECLRLLKPGGTLVIVTPNAQGLGHKLMGRNWLHLDPPRHLHLFNSLTLARLCRDAGFNILASRSTMRDASGILTAWMNLRFSNYHNMERSPSLGHRFVSNLWQFLASGIVKMFTNVGDELVCVAQKPGAHNVSVRNSSLGDG